MVINDYVVMYYDTDDVLQHFIIEDVLSIDDALTIFRLEFGDDAVVKMIQLL